jgi:cardiolipin synthase (CMP-forming)
VSLRQLPNLICVARMALVVPVAWLLARGDYTQTLWLFAIAAASDGLDGFLAKRFGWTSELGKVLDPLADKLLLVTVFIVLAAIGKSPAWLSVVVVARDVVIGVGALTFKWLFGPLNGRATAISKINTGVQLIYVLALVAHLGLGFPPLSVVITLGAAVFVTTMISGIDYVITYSRRAAAVSRARSA